MYLFTKIHFTYLFEKLGMDKILYGIGRNEGQVQVTNDGATILKAVGVDNPCAKVLVDMSKVQDDEVGDGTTSVVVLASELLREAEKLIGKSIFQFKILSLDGST